MQLTGTSMCIKIIKLSTTKDCKKAILAQLKISKAPETQLKLFNIHI